MGFNIRRLRVAIILQIVLVAASALLPMTARALSPGQIEGQLPADGGAALVVWGGGPPGALAEAARSQGCRSPSFWIAAGGTLMVYIDGAPVVVNVPFTAQFEAGTLPPGIALVVICSQVGFGASNTVAATPPPPPPPAALASIQQQFAAAAANGINSARQGNGLPPLKFDSRLQAAAESYAGLLIIHGQLSHTLDGEPWDRAQRAGYPSTLVGEVIASRSTSEVLDVPQDTAVLVQAWLDSPPHREIIMGKDFAFIDVGVGCATGRDADGLNLVICVALTGVP